MGDTDCLIVSFVTSVINIYLVSTKELIYTFAASAEAMKLIKCSSSANSVLAYGTTSTHFFSMDNKEGIISKQLEFNNSKDMVECVYLKEQDRILITHEDCVALYSIPP